MQEIFEDDLSDGREAPMFVLKERVPLCCRFRAKRIIKKASLMLAAKVLIIII